MTNTEEIVRATRERLGPVGIWSGAIQSAPVALRRPAVLRAEELGYGSVFGGERIGGGNAFAQAAIALAATSTIVCGTGIANLWARHAAAMQGGAAALAEGWPGRLVLGIGVSHAPLVEHSGQSYVTPMDRMRDYLDVMDAEAEASGVPVAFPRVLAALGPKMLELARQRAEGAHPYFVPPSHTPSARQALGPDRLLIPEQAVVLSTDPAEARRMARSHMAMYLRLPNYVRNLTHHGFDDDDVTDGGSDRLVDAIVAWGDDAAIASRVEELRSSGADHVLLQPLADDVAGVVHQMEALAPALGLGAA